MRFSRWITSRWNASHMPAANDRRAAQVLSLAGLGEFTYAQIAEAPDECLARIHAATPDATDDDLNDIARILDEFVAEVDEAAKRREVLP